jgi:hypothetical protein
MDEQQRIAYSAKVSKRNKGKGKSEKSRISIARTAKSNGTT